MQIQGIDLRNGMESTKTHKITELKDSIVSQQSIVYTTPTIATSHDFV